MKNSAVKRHIKLYITDTIKFWGIFIISLLLFSIVCYTFVTKSLIKGLIITLALLIVLTIILLIPLGVICFINITRFKKLIRYQEEKYNITFDDNDFKKIQINLDGERKEYIHYNNDWFVISGVIALYYKEVLKSKRKRIHGRYGIIYLHYITLKNNIIYKFRGNYKYYPKFKEWLDRENMVSK